MNQSITKMPTMIICLKQAKKYFSKATGIIIKICLFNPNRLNNLNP